MRIAGKVSSETHADIVRVQLQLRAEELPSTLADTAKYLCDLALADKAVAKSLPSEPAMSTVNITSDNAKDYATQTTKYRTDRAIGKNNAFVSQVIRHGIALWKAGKRLPRPAPPPAA